MRSSEVRDKFQDFFKSKDHKIVHSAPMVVKDDPTLMFTNAGMNQFKDIFLGNVSPKYVRVANSQKCLRVSGKHNDLEEVGHDTYHHTMFEMLGNWSFGDYFKKEAIAWAWELLTRILGIDKNDLYATVFEGDSDDGLPADHEALTQWKTILPEKKILFGSKKDNFWEMGEAGPCGPCSEIHIDLRDRKEKEKTPGAELINTGHPLVIEIWNLVFIEFNRQADGKLVSLPQKHVDTGMGFERLCMVLQGKKSNYDTDIFKPILGKIEEIAGIAYGQDKNTDVAMRVIADHLRAISFAIADGQLPSNTGAGYVIRRILRRAVRYGFTFLGLKEPFINALVPVLVIEMGAHYPELEKQEELIKKVVAEEEQAFLRTLSTGIRRFEQYVQDHPGLGMIEGAFAFELFDTYGFPVDLTRLMAQEISWDVDMKGFQEGLESQKSRSRKAAQVDAHEWVIVKKSEQPTAFVGYKSLEAGADIVRYRKVKAKGESFCEIVLDHTPFYAESGGQVGDKGYILSGEQRIMVTDTYRENELIIHKTTEEPQDPAKPVKAVVDGSSRRATASNHSATHLMHAALRKILGAHVEQKGSLVDERHLRFDFSHFSRMTDEQIEEVERMVNSRIRENIPVDEKKEIPIEEAKAMGAMALFGEKYGEQVRVISFNPEYSVELCGGTHVAATGQIGFFKIISENAIAAGIRRIEAVTGPVAEDFVYEKQHLISDFEEVLKNDKDPLRGLQNLVEESKSLRKKVSELSRYYLEALKEDLIRDLIEVNGVKYIGVKLDVDMQMARDLAYLMKQNDQGIVLLIGTTHAGKANLTLMVDESLVKEKGLDAGKMIRKIATEIKGGGGGQPHFATAGGPNVNGLDAAIAKAKEIIENS